MDIKAKIEELVEKIKNDKTLLKDFQENPGKAVEKLIGIDLPEEQINVVVNGIKAKLTADKAADLLGGLGGLFKK